MEEDLRAVDQKKNQQGSPLTEPVALIAIAFPAALAMTPESLDRFHFAVRKLVTRLSPFHGNDAELLRLGDGKLARHQGLVSEQS